MTRRWVLWSLLCCACFGTGTWLLAVEDDPVRLLWGRGPIYWSPLLARRVGVALDVNEPPLIHCIFGNPFRPVSLDLAVLTWNDATVVRLAQAAYDERHLPAGTLDNGRLAVLADALEEAGCTSEDVLGHLRGPGPHVRGCWAVDLLLGKG
jgi:hypothetical protein